MKHNIEMTNSLSCMSGRYEHESPSDFDLPDLSVCAETFEDDILTAESICRQYASHITEIKNEVAIEELTKYFTNKVCQETVCYNIADAWNLYKQMHNIE